MARTTLAERASRLEQQKARIAEQEAKIKLEERKARTRRLIEAGGLVEKTGLLALEPNALYGALLSLRDAASDKDQVATWEAAGGRAFAREKAALDATKEPLVITFGSALPTSFTSQLRAAGLRWNKVLHHWEGLAEYDRVAQLAAEHQGEIRRVRMPAAAVAAE